MRDDEIETHKASYNRLINDIENKVTEKCSVVNKNLHRAENEVHRLNQEVELLKNQNQDLT